MLKIKDNVDLKELEKFGIKYDEEDNCYNGNWISIEIYDEIYHKENTRKIYVGASAYLDTLYDLIQAGLVEKVDEVIE